MLPAHSVKVVLITATILLGMVVFTFATDDNPDKKKRPPRMSTEIYQSYPFNINNVFLPMSSYGTLGQISIDGQYGIQFDERTIMFGLGFMMTGYSDGVLWANSQSSYYTGNDYLPGTIGMSPSSHKAKLYILKKSEGDFSESWYAWRTAVELGAYFYDGNGDGKYYPVDLNGDGKWNENEDKPDLIGDETVFCVLNDGLDAAFRRINDVNPQGIEVGQTVFAFTSTSEIGNVFFIRYSLHNSGTQYPFMDSVYFNFWSDADLGTYWDDLIGTDEQLQGVYSYNDGPDYRLGQDPPAAMVQILQGPVIETGSSTDTAYYYNSSTAQSDTLIGFVNRRMAASNHITDEHPTQQHPRSKEEVYYLSQGLNNEGDTLSPCTFILGEVLGETDCDLINPFLHFNGDPVEGKGWIMNEGDDYKMTVSVGPFDLAEDKPVDIIGAVIFGKGEDHLQSLEIVKNTARKTELLFKNGFQTVPPLPKAEPVIRSGEGFIELSWKTADVLNFELNDTLLGIKRDFQAFRVYALQTPKTAQYIEGIKNHHEIAHYELNDSIGTIYTDAENGGSDILYQAVSNEDQLLDSLIFEDTEKGRIVLRLYKDPITGNDFIKGHQYNFLITAIYLDNDKLEKISPAGNEGVYEYHLTNPNGYQESESAIKSFLYGEDMFSPAFYGLEGSLKDGYTDGTIKYYIINPGNATGQRYSVEVKRDTTSEIYSNYWLLKNENTDELLDSSSYFNFDTTDFSGKVYDGFILKVKPVYPSIASLQDQEYSSAAGSRWCTAFSVGGGTGAYYAGDDILQTEKTNPLFPNATGSSVNASNLRTIELRFQHGSGKAYRYLNGFGSNPLLAIRSYIYAEGITASDTLDRGSVGKLGAGFVDVPVTAWIHDERYEEERQLAIGFIERSTEYGGNPDGHWDPGTDLSSTREVLIIFDAPYDPAGGNMLYTGGTFSNGSTIWADVVNGYPVPPTETSMSDSLKSIAGHDFFNAIYIVNLERKNEVSFYADGDRLRLPVTAYPYDNDIFTFITKPGSGLAVDESKALYDKVNVFPNPLLGYNPGSAYSGGLYDRPFVTFSHLPRDITVTIYSLSGMKIKTLTTEDKSSPGASYLEWDLRGENGITVASGFYIAIIDSPLYGQKILKFSLVMPQYQLRR